MNIHEYQAKELFDRYGVPSPKGRVASSPKEAFEAAKYLGIPNLVVKAQDHAGGRGTGTFKNGFKDDSFWVLGNVLSGRDKLHTVSLQAVLVSS